MKLAFGPLVTLPADSSMFVALGRGRIAPERRAQFIASARTSVAMSQAEPGAIAYHLMADLLEPDIVYAVEVWASEAAFNAHLAAPHHVQRVRELAAMGYELLGGTRYDVKSWQSLPPVDLRSLFERTNTGS